MLQRVLALTNAYREQYHLPPLKLSAELTTAAQDYAKEMAEKEFMEHVGPDGTHPRDRIQRAGYPMLYCGENLAMGYSTPEQTLKAWMNSPSHRVNILNPDYDEIGLGYATGFSTHYGDACAYWVQEFATRRSCRCDP